MRSSSASVGTELAVFAAGAFSVSGCRLFPDSFQAGSAGGFRLRRHEGRFDPLETPQCMEYLLQSLCIAIRHLSGKVRGEIQVIDRWMHRSQLDPELVDGLL
jgi:hypothetical protein